MATIGQHIRAVSVNLVRYREAYTEEAIAQHYFPYTDIEPLLVEIEELSQEIQRLQEENDGLRSAMERWREVADKK